MPELMDFSVEPQSTAYEAIERIKTALANVSDEKAVQIAQIVEEIVDISE